MSIVPHDHLHQAAVRLRVLFVVLLLAAVAPGAGAQREREAHVGDRIRFRRAVDDRLIVARLVAVAHDSVSYEEFCAHCRPTTVGRLALSDIAVSDGRRHTISRTLVGTAVGALVAAGGWILFVAATERGCHDGPCGAGVIFTPAAAATGGLAGGLAGWWWKGEQWVPATLPDS